MWNFGDGYRRCVSLQKILHWTCRILFQAFIGQLVQRRITIFGNQTLSQTAVINIECESTSFRAFLLGCRSSFQFNELFASYESLNFQRTFIRRLHIVSKKYLLQAFCTLQLLFWMKMARNIIKKKLETLVQNPF